MWKLFLSIGVLVMCVGCGSMVSPSTPSQSQIESIKKHMGYFKKDGRCYAISVYAGGGSHPLLGAYTFTRIDCDESIKE